MSGANWQGQEGTSADCTLNPMILFGILASGEHPCDRCNADRAKCRGFPPKPTHAAKMEESGMSWHSGITEDRRKEIAEPTP